MLRQYTNPLQTYVVKTHAEAIAAGCDIVQHKYRGDFKQYNPGGSNDVILLGNVFAGEKWEGTPVFDTMYVWDCTHFNGNDIRNLPYRERWAIIRAACGELGGKFRPITNQPIANAWNSWLKVDGDSMCGLIYRNSRSTFTLDVYHTRWYKELPGGLP